MKAFSSTSQHLVKLADSSSIQIDDVPLDRRTVKLAYQIKDFVRTGHASAGLVKPSTGEVINYITARQPRPFELAATVELNPDRERTSRSRSASLEPTSYFPIDWPVDKPAFRKAVATFVKDTRQLAEKLSPSSDSASTSLETTAESSKAGSTSQTSKASASQTSAEEAIYQEPIGPAIDADIIMSDTNNDGANRNNASGNDNPRNFNGTGFTQQQWTALQGLISNINVQPGPQGQQGERGQQAMPGVPGVPGEGTSSSSTERWNSADLGYFDPHLEKSYGEGEIVTVGKDLYYRSVILFVERVRDLATVKGDALVRTNLNTSLRGAALRWYTAELSNLERTGLRNDPRGVEEWCSALLRRFKELPGVALSHLTSEKYTMADARAKREPADYVQAIMRHAKAADIDSLLNQLTFAHQGIAAELRVFIDPPSSSTTVASFIQSLEMRKDAWFELNSRHVGQRLPGQSNQRQAFRSLSQQPNQNQGQQFYRQQQQQYDHRPYSQQHPFPYRPYSSDDQNAYKSQQYGYQPNPRYEPRTPQQQLPSRRPPLQITGPPNGSGSTSSSNRPPQGGPSQRRFGNQGFGNRQPLRKAAAYQASTAEEGTEDQTQDDQHDDEPHESYQGSEDVYQEDEYEHDQENQPEESFAGFVGIEASCRNCNATFKSKSKLHKHLRQDCLVRGLQKPSATDVFAHPPKSPKLLTKQEMSANAFSVEIVDSDATDRTNVGTGLAFRGWNYAHILVRMLLTAIDEEVCIDTGCGVTLADKPWLLALLPEVEIRRMPKALRVKGLGTAMHDTDEYVLVPMYLPAVKQDGTRVLCRIVREIHLVDNLKAHMLIGNDIVGPEKIVLDVNQSKAFIGSCDATADITCRQRGQQYTRAIHARKTLTIPPRSECLIPVAKLSDVPTERDFLFEPIAQTNITLYAHLVDAKVHGVIAKNETDRHVRISKKQRLGTLCELDYENAFFAEHSSPSPPKEPPLKQPKGTLRKPSPSSTSWIKKAATIATAAAFSISATMNNLLPNHDMKPSAAMPLSQQDVPNLLAKETRLPNGVMVYGDKHATSSLANLVSEFPSVWKDEGFVKVPQDDWMKITLRDDWQTKLQPKVKIYPLGQRDRDVVDKTFDEMHRQGRLEYTTQATPFSYPVFVVWKTLPDGSRKGRAVIDIRGLNDLIVPDVYPVPLQAEVIARLLGCTHIAVMDAMSFFYQWRTHPDFRYMLTVISHRGQETFNVPVMGCMNSIAYVQRQIDRILRPVKAFASAYVDDVVTGAKSFSEHLANLRQLFELFVEHNISISPTKTFLGYPNVNLLGRRVDSFGLATAEDKLEAIKALKYPSTLGDLEHYLGLAGYLRNHVHYFAQLAQPLQALKTSLLKQAPTKGNPRRAYASSYKLGKPSPAELASFTSLQEALCNQTTLAHHDPERVMWVDLDASKDGFGVRVFHVKKGYEVPTGKWPARHAMETILFLSRELSSAEKNYWPTELEIAGFVWTIKKIRHMVESCKHPVIIQTDHSAIVDIMRKSSITATTSTVRMNTRLVRASQFLRQFRLDVRHKPGKEHIVPDALSRLASTKPSTIADDHSELDALFAGYEYHSTQVNMSEAFRNRLLEGYDRDPRWAKIIGILEDKKSTEQKFGSEVADLPFVRGEDGLIFHVGKFNGIERLCIPEPLVKDIFDMAHSEGHPGFERCKEVIAKSWYIHGLTRLLRDYIRHCPQCLVYQTRRHRPYGALQPIESPPIPFHTLTLDFILALPTTPEGFDCVLTVTDKFTKRTTHIPGKSTWKAHEWAAALLDRLNIADWGLPMILLTDRDPKFLAELWEAIFKQLGVELLYSTAYHPQTDGSSERTNQTTEIALRFYIHTLDRITDWPKVLPRIQALLNNMSSSTTTKTPNELSYGFKLNRPLDLMTANQPSPQPKLARLEAADAISFAQMQQKFHYDRRHQPMYMKKGEEAFLRLHHGYSIPSANSKKLGQQYVGPFKILERIGKQAYRLDIPPHWKVHPVFSIAQLEPAPGSDPYRRPVPDHPDSVFVEGDTPEFKSYVVERLLNKRSRQAGRGGKGHIVEYLVRWLGYGPAYDTWYNVKDLENCMDLVQEYEEDLNGITSLWQPSPTSPAAILAPLPPQDQPRKRGRPRKQVPSHLAIETPVLPVIAAAPEMKSLPQEAHLPKPSSQENLAIAGPQPISPSQVPASHALRKPSTTSRLAIEPPPST